MNSDFMLAERVARLEGAMGLGADTKQISNQEILLALCLVWVGIAGAIVGVGFPNHHYQFIFATLLIGLAYHRGWLLVTHQWLWLLALVSNTLLVSFFLKVFLGAGRIQPFEWMRIPALSSESGNVASGFVPSWSLQWQDLALSQFVLDLTTVQTFLLLVSIIGGLFGFQPFASLTAFALVIVSIPSLFSFDWNWVLISTVVGVVGLYIQGGRPSLRARISN